MRAVKDNLDRFAAQLWDERQELVLLVYRLTVVRLLILANERRFVVDALEDVAVALDRVRMTALQRDDSVRELASLWETDPNDLTLPEVIRRAPTPYDHMLRDHLEEFRTLADELETVATENRVAGVAAMEDVTKHLNYITGEAAETPSTYDASGRVGPVTPVGSWLRETL